MFDLGPMVAAAWFVGALVRDRLPVTTPLFYIPAPLAAAAGGLWLLLAPRRAPIARICVAALTAAAAAKTLGRDFAWHASAPCTPKPIRVVHWNVARGARAPDLIWPTLAADHADICLISESPTGRRAEAAMAGLFPRTYRHAEAGMTLLSRFPVRPVDSLAIPGVRAWSARVATPAGVFDLLAVDFVSHPWRGRDEPLAALADWVDRHDPEIPLVVLGDFNTARDSVWFAPLRRRLRHAYEIAGRGWPYSWPAPVALYAIDHAWVSQGVALCDYVLRTAPCSDHRRQILDLTLPPLPRSP